MNTTDSIHEQKVEPGQCNVVSPAESALRFRPAVDLLEDTGEFIMKVDMPGVDHSTVQVTLERNELKIVGTTCFDGPQDAQTVVGAVGPRVYERVFQLADDLDRDHVVAEVKQGVLTLRLPKSAKAQKVQLQIKSGT